jgi:hypothetical protein
MLLAVEPKPWFDIEEVIYKAFLVTLCAAAIVCTLARTALACPRDEFRRWQWAQLQSSRE